MDITDNVTSDPSFQIDVDQAIAFCKMFICSENDFPDISLGYCLSVLEPVNHALDKFVRDTIFPIPMIQFRPGVLLVDLTSTLCLGQLEDTRMALQTNLLL